MALRSDYQERKNDVIAYLDFLKQIDQPGNVGAIKISVTQRNILRSNAFLLLYNLVESTISLCGKELSDAFAHFEVKDVSTFTEQIREHWIKRAARYHKTNPKERLKGLVDFYEKLKAQNVALDFIFEFKADGNLDDLEIETIFSGYGISTTMPKSLCKEVRHFRYDREKGILQVIRELRNELAHGLRSFSECGKICSYTELETNSKIVFEYLEFIIGQVEDYITNQRFYCVEQFPQSVSQETN